MLLKQDEYGIYGLDASDPKTYRDMRAVEAKIRSHTHNRFHVRGVSVDAKSEGGAILASHPWIKVGDTVEVEESTVNDGLYQVVSVADGKTVLDGDLLDAPFNHVTLVRYPDDIVDGAIGILEYDKAMPKANAAVASETISRHSVTYRQVSAADQFAGYPAEVTAFLKPYMRARF
ncbi:hypothetical protein [Gordonibacter urolithinfaciens]|uniref:hypothetical protein n=1 Tax=Gordonibacter urolithinfaciens TaxID=1335613 RepID=UPI0034BF8FCC